MRKVETITPAKFIIQKLGGLTKTAAAISTEEKRVPISTVQGWQDRGKIPQEHWQKIIEAGEEQGVTIELGMFLSVPEGAAA